MSDPEKNKKKKLSRASYATLARLVREYVLPYWPRLLIGMALGAITATANGAMAWVLDPLIDDVIGKQQTDLLYILAGGMVAIGLVGGISAYLADRFIHGTGYSVIADVQKHVFTHLLQSDIARMMQKAPGELISRFTYDANNLLNATSRGLTGLSKDLLKAIVLIITMFHADWQLAILGLIVLPTAIAPVARIGRKMRKVSANTQSQFGSFTSVLDESFRGIRIVKAYGMEDHQSERVFSAIDDIRNLSIRAVATRAMSQPIMQTLVSFAFASVMVYGGLRVMEGSLEAGDLVKFLTAAALSYQPLRSLATLNVALQQGVAAADALFNILDTKPTIVSKDGARDLQIKGAEIDFKDVQFAYNDQDVVIDRLSLSVPAGKTVALVGPSGSGKSTLLNLISRFYDVQKGSVQIDGQSIADVSLESLRAQIALVTQDVLLFDETIRDNIMYGKPDASEAQLIAAAQAADAHNFIMSLPKGYDTVVGTGGGNLSGGQRQRVAIARAMLKDSPILLLDEATSALDAESERHVQLALDRLMTGRSSVVIAHRLATIRHADIIYVIEKGRVAEAGTHDDLLAAQGAYAKLYKLQFESQAV